MIRFNEANGYFYSTDQGRIASHFYIKYDTVEVINDNFRVNLEVSRRAYSDVVKHGIRSSLS